MEESSLKNVGKPFVRVFDPPREKVWKVWTDPEYVKLWLGPKDFNAPFISIDLQVGGSGLFIASAEREWMGQ